jgi:hypothetical protein
MATREEEWTYWNAKNEELRRTQLETVQQAAAGWATLFAALLGVFGTVAFAGGLTTLDKLGSPWDAVARVLTAAAAVLGAVATYLAATASHSLSPKQQNELDADSLRVRSGTAAAKSHQALAWAKGTGFAAVLLVLGGSGLVLFLGEGDGPGDPPTAVVVIDGRAVCGRLQASADGGLRVAGETLDEDVTGVTVVAACP